MTPKEYIATGDAGLTCTETQAFGGNATATYAASGLKGHPAVDIACGFGTPIKPFVPIYVYKILDVAHPSWDGSGYTGVFGIDAQNNEWVYGHCDPTAEVGKWYGVNDTIGTEANHGEVYSGGVRITLEMQQAGDQRGHHRHVQFRPCDAVKVTNGTLLSTYNAGPYRDAQGNYYQYRYPDNGYSGCMDWTLEFGSLSDKILGAAAVLEAEGDPDASKLSWASWLVKKLTGK